MKIYIIGSGGVGGFLGGKLALSGNDVTFLARGSHFKAIKENGLKLNTVEGNFTVSPVNVIDSLSQIKDPVNEVIYGAIKLVNN